jgi:hypothetical protein
MLGMFPQFDRSCRWHAPPSASMVAKSDLRRFIVQAWCIHPDGEGYLHSRT